MARTSHSSHAMAALLLIGMVASVSVSATSVRSPALFRRSLLTNPPAPAPTYSDISGTPNRTTDNPATFSGLQDIPSIGNTTVIVGHYLDGTGLQASLNYSSGPGGAKASNASSTGSWGQAFTYSSASGNGDTRPDIFESSTGITIDSLKFNQKNYVWMLDTFSGTAYKIDTSNSSSGTSSVKGVFQTSPSSAYQPVLVAVDSVGAAWVGNLNTVGSTFPSVVRILSSGCTGTYSSNSTLTAGNWTGSTSNDGCVMQYTSLSDKNLTITAMAIDGGDNLWVVATNSFTGLASTNYLSIFKIASGTSTATLMYGPIMVPTGAVGAPGGNSAVVDQYGYLWTGSGPFLYNSTDPTSYSVLRFDTSSTSAILAVQVSDEANQLNLDADSNLWVAGAAHVTKIFTKPSTVSASSSSFTATSGGSAITIALSSSTIISLNLATSSLATACSGNSQDGCCTAGGFDTGIAITRNVVANGTSYVASNLNTIYVANTCQTGLVYTITNVAGSGTPTLGPIISVGSNLQSIAADRTSNIWLAATFTTDSGLSNVVYVVSNITATAVTGLTYAAGFQTLGGQGDLTGYITAQPTTTATYTYIHDTAITGYSKWVAGQIGWTIDAYGSYAVTAQTGDNYTTIQSASTPLTFIPLQDVAMSASIGSGRYLRVDVQLTRNTAKVSPFVGPQGHGSIPTLTEIRVLAFDHEPNADCASDYVNATDDTATNGGTGGAYPNAVTGYCTQGPPITIDNGSFDSDTQETDKLIITGYTTGTTILYKNQSYINTLPTFVLETSYSPSQLTVFDYHGKKATCSATVAVYDSTAPTYIGVNLPVSYANAKLQVDSGSAPALCAWPPNGKYLCKLNVFSQTGGRFIQTDILPVRDNCAAVPGFAMSVNGTRTTNGALPTLTAGFSCTDTDPRSQLGDCVLVPDGTQYHACVKAQRRTVFTNLDRVYTLNFRVQDAGTQQGLNVGTIFSRSLRVPPIWKFYSPTVCARASYPSSASTVGAVSGSPPPSPPPLFSPPPPAPIAIIG